MTEATKKQVTLNNVCFLLTYTMCALRVVHVLLWSEPNPALETSRGWSGPHPSGLIVPNALLIAHYSAFLCGKCKRFWMQQQQLSWMQLQLTTKLWPAVPNPMIQCTNNIGLGNINANTNLQIMKILIYICKYRFANSMQANSQRLHKFTFQYTQRY